MAREIYLEILRLEAMLQENNIPYEMREYLGGWQICYPNNAEVVCSVIEHDESYGRTEDRLEIMGLLTADEEKYDSVAGHLTAEDVFSRIKNDYEDVKLLEKLKEETK